MDLWQFTPLHEAASKNRVEVCSLLLSHGADPTLVNCHGKSAVDMAPTPELRERLTCMYLYPEITVVCCKVEYLVFVQLLGLVFCPTWIISFHPDIYTGLKSSFPIIYFSSCFHRKLTFILFIYSNLILQGKTPPTIAFFKAENEAVTNHLLIPTMCCAVEIQQHKPRKKSVPTELTFLCCGCGR